MSNNANNSNSNNNWGDFFTRSFDNLSRRLSLNSNSVDDDKRNRNINDCSTPGKTTSTTGTTRNEPTKGSVKPAEDTNKAKIAPAKHTEEAKLPPVKKSEEERTKSSPPVKKPEEERNKSKQQPPPAVTKPETSDVDDDDDHPGRRDPANKCAAVVIGNEFKEHLDLIGHDFSRVDNYARATPESETCSVERLSKYLTSRWNNPVDKLRAIFTWIATNVEYDTDAFFSGNIRHQDADETLKTRKGVCDGYAELFNGLASHAGLKTWKITGRAKGHHFKPGDDIDSREFAHAWNGTLYKGEYLLIDSTWGAGAITDKKFERRFEPFYFLTRPTYFIYTHIPKDPKEQYISPQLTKQDFINLTHVKPPYFAAGLEFREILGTSITTDDDWIDLEIARYHPDEGKPLHAILIWNGKEHEVLIQRVAGYDASAGKVYRLQATCPSRGEGKLELYVMVEGNKGPLASSFLIKNKGSGKNYSPFVKTYRVPFNFTIQSPIHLNLKCNKQYKFEFCIFDLKESDHPEFSLITPNKSLQKFHKASRCEDGSVTYELETTVDQKGDWRLVFSRNGKNFDFVAMYHVE